jgi:hypothetical protein
MDTRRAERIYSPVPAAKLQGSSLLPIHVEQLLNARAHQGACVEPRNCPLTRLFLVKTLSVTSPRPRTAAVAASLPRLSRCAAPKAHALRLLEARRRHLLERAPAGRHRWRLRTLCGRRSRALTGGRSFSEQLLLAWRSGGCCRTHVHV